MKKIDFAVLVLFITISMNLFAQKTWTGASSTAWNTASNWSPSGVPSASDNVIIASAANQPQIMGTTGVCNAMVINSGATLTITATTTTNASLTATGSVTVNGSLNLSGAIKSAKLIASGIYWAAGSSMSGTINTQIDISGNWEFATGSAVTIQNTSVTFTGSVNTFIYSNSASSSFNSITLNKNAGYSVSIQATSTSTLNIGGGLTINAGNAFYGSVNLTTILKGNLASTGNFYFSSGTVSLEKSSGTQTVQINSGDYFYNLKINTGGTVTLNNNTLIKGAVIIQAGVFDPLNNAVSVQGDWTNSVGATGFTEGTGKVIFNGGNYHQYCSNETFNILEVNKSAGGAFRVNGSTVTCNQYDWTAGSIDVLGSGTFTASDLADQGIRGNYYVNTGSTINLYQDATQYVDLGGSLNFTGGGTINVYGGNGTVSQWPTYANASITMNGGTLDFKDQGITINTLSGYSLTTNISGGTIRTPRNFFCNRSDFNLTGGTVELYGSINSSLDMINGSLWNLKINKPSETVTLNTTLTLGNTLEVTTGTFSVSNKILTIPGNVNIFADGVFYLGPSSQLILANGKYLYVNNGGMLKTEGAGSDNVNVTSSSGYYFLQVQSGGTISSRYTYFQKMNTINMQSGSTVDPANSFYKCTFTNNSAAYASMLIFLNTQDITIKDASFPLLNSSYTTSKPNDAGHVYFKDATGAYAGAAHENDPYNRIDWVASTPGLWTGIVSSTWSNEYNWDDEIVPDETTDVTIPGGTPHSPVIISGNAECYNFVIETGAILTQNEGTNLYVNGVFDADEGQFIMNGTSFLYFTGPMGNLWYSNNDNIYANIRILKINGSFVELEDYDSVNCNGTFVIMEGGLHNDGYITINDAGDHAFEVEDGGRLYTYFEIVVNGSAHFYTGSYIYPNDHGSIRCGKDFIAEPGVDVGALNRLFMNGSGTQYIDIQPGNTSTLNYLNINKTGGVCYLKSSDLQVNEFISIFQGTLSANNGPSPTETFDIYLNGTWKISQGFFEPGSGKVVFSGNNSGYCQNGNFNILEIAKTADTLEIRENVTCNAYDWTSGSIKVINGATFTANDLLDNAIKGSFTCEEGATLNISNTIGSTFVDLAGEIHNYGGTINISGSVAYWPYGGDAVLEMTGGVIDLKTSGLNIHDNSYSLAVDITGGTIRTPFNYSGNRADFTPAAGTFEFYGSNNAFISQSNGCSLNNIVINKSATKGEGGKSGAVIDPHSGDTLSEGGKANLITLNSDLVLTNSLIIQSGQLATNNYKLTLEGDWNNLVGPDGFIEGIGRVVFAGIKAQICSSEEFYILEVNKPLQNLYNNTNASISCQVYDWTQGGIWIAGDGNFFAADLADEGIRGNWTLYGNSIELHQDNDQSAGIMGNVSIVSGDFDVYGGSLTNSLWGNFSDVNFTMTGGTLDYHDAAINIHEYNPPHLVNINISGGLIRCQKGFFISNPAFQPAGGTLEFYGNDYYRWIDIDNGATLYELIINLSPGFDEIVYAVGNIPVEYVTVNSGELRILSATGNLYVGQSLLVSGPEARFYNSEGGTVFENNTQFVIENGGKFRNNGALILGNNTSININNNSSATFNGNVNSMGLVTTVNPTDKYGIYVNSGGTIGACYTRFENMNNDGITINSGGSIDPYTPVLSFDNCEFTNGASGGFPLLSFHNEQDIVIDFAGFPENTWGGLNNVAKTNDAGSVTFRGIIGEFAGEAFEYDPYNRIHWLDEANGLDVKVWLEGPFNGTDMNTGLTGSPDFPLSQPFNSSPWNYDGTELLTTIPPDIVDWVLVELRTSDLASQAGSDDLLTRRAALLRKDGSIVDLDGISPVQFSYSPYTWVFAVIHHRNHLSIISYMPCSVSSNVYSFDFRTEVLKAYGGEAGYKELSPGVAVMVAGDGNADGSIQNSDKTSTWTPGAAKKGYFPGDFSLDSQVDNKDKNDFWLPNLIEGFSSQVPD